MPDKLNKSHFMGGHAFWVWEELEEEYWVVRGIFCLSIRVFFPFFPNDFDGIDHERWDQYED
jgi:hypothetical protein